MARGEPQGELRGTVSAAEESEARLRNFAFLVENASDFIGICNTEFTPIYVNAAALSLVGLRPEQLPSTSVFDFFVADERERLAGEFFPAVERDGHGSIETGSGGGRDSAASIRLHPAVRRDAGPVRLGTGRDSTGRLVAQKPR